ncbi:MAG: 6-phosphogluconolactonase [Gammaproteobacteria bacterium]|nr:6-phosphogluconolactonase [Gammaproteobacteria bacterium]
MLKPRLVVDADAAVAAAVLIARAVDAALAERNRATLALSGGRMAPPLYSALADATVDWSRVIIVQTDERIVAPADVDRNWRAFLASPLGRRVPRANLRPMPVDAAADGSAYARTLRAVAGDPPVLDVVHLGLGSDGHTASLFAGDAALAEEREPVCLTASHQGHRRMTLTLPTLRRARLRLWLVCGAPKRYALARLLAGDAAAVATRALAGDSVVVADAAAAADVLSAAVQDRTAG